MAADRMRHHHNPHHGADPRAATPSCGGSPAWDGMLHRRQLLGELITLVLCGASAPIVMVLVAWHGWPLWWLVIAGMLIAWAGDALWTVADHTVGLARLRRATTVDAAHPVRPGDFRTPGVGPQRSGEPSSQGDRP